MTYMQFTEQELKVLFVSVYAGRHRMKVAPERNDVPGMTRADIIAACESILAKTAAVMPPR